MYSLQDGGSHRINLVIEGLMHAKTSSASVIWNWLSCNLADWITIISFAWK